MFDVLHIDAESRSAGPDLKETGAFLYWMHPSTEPWVICFAFGEGPIQRWILGQPCPPAIAEHIKKGGKLISHNAAFERAMFDYCLGPRFGWPVPKAEQWFCTMAMAYAQSLPGSLEEAAAAVGLPAQKDMDGRRLILQMAKPRRVEACSVCKGDGHMGLEFVENLAVGYSSCMACDGSGKEVIWWFDEERKQRGYTYCAQDVEVERQLEKRLMQLRPQERQIWLLDAEINTRGVYIDKSLCDAALKVVENTQALLDKEIKLVTGNAVSSCGAVSALVKWLNANGVPTDTVNKEAIDEMLGGWELSPAARRAIEIRKEAAKTSTAKIKKMLTMRNPVDGRMRGNLQYHGAATGRWAARGAQLQNLPRPNKKTNVNDAIETILTGGSPLLSSELHGPPLSVVSDCIRGMIAAPKGHEIMAADFSAIEARAVAWLAGQQDAVLMFARGEDIYSRQATVIYQKPINRKLPEHATEGLVGKVAILALGYQGGANAFAKMAGNYGIKLEPLYEPVWSAATPENREKAKNGYKQRGTTSRLSEKAWTAAELIKLAWRDANSNIVQYWWDLEQAAVDAVNNPGALFRVRNVAYKVSGSFLWCQLPSGRVLCYPYPKIKQIEVPWKSKVPEWVFCDSEAEAKFLYGLEVEYDKVRMAALVYPNAKKPAVVYKAVDALTNKWTDKAFYGGLACENITQAVARDLMAEAMLRVDAAGYKVIITIHDEVVCEVPEGFGSVDEFVKIMSEVPEWARGCPVSAEGWRGKRYRK